MISERSSGRPDEQENQKLLDELQSGNPSTKVNAVLKYLYFVRCNMFHGSKDFEHRQLEIVRPASRCLERVIRAGLDKLTCSRR